jgi:replication factor C small subunit
MKPWTEKYRPKTLSEFVGQDEVVSLIKSMIKRGKMLNLLFYGTPGTGKTTMAYCIARELFGEAYLLGIKEINASDQRSINDIRALKVYLKTTGLISYISDYDFKILLLDECDGLKNDSQECLRRMMETFSPYNCIILSCNKLNKIIEPIRSRCLLLKFKPFSPNDIKENLERIANHEGLESMKDFINNIAKTSKGDMRKAVMNFEVGVGKV